jgi:hypothetical protein
MDNIIDQFDAVDDEPMMDATLDIEIDVVFQKKPFTSLHLREPKAKEIERAEKELVPNPTPYHFRRYQMVLIAQVARVPIEVIGELTNTQLRKAWDFLRQQLDNDTPEIGAS